MEALMDFVDGYLHYTAEMLDRLKPLKALK